jgi:hypothetical protein
MKPVKPIALLLLLMSSGVAQQQNWPKTFVGRRVMVTKPQVGGDGEPLGPAVICLFDVSGQQCYTPPEHDVPFGLNPEATAVRLTNNIDGLLFTAEASAGGSGSSNILALLVPGQGARLRNLFPSIVVSEQSEHQFIYRQVSSDMPIFAVADYLWSDGETHFSRHRFTISVYTYGKNVPYYQLRDQYVTAKKYPSLDEADAIVVIAHEKPEILARLARQK